MTHGARREVGGDIGLVGQQRVFLELGMAGARLRPGTRIRARDAQQVEAGELGELAQLAVARGVAQRDTLAEVVLETRREHGALDLLEILRGAVEIAAVDALGRHAGSRRQRVHRVECQVVETGKPDGGDAAIRHVVLLGVQ